MFRKIIPSPNNKEPIEWALIGLTAWSAIRTTYLCSRFFLYDLLYVSFSCFNLIIPEALCFKQLNCYDNSNGKIEGNYLDLIGRIVHVGREFKTQVFLI